MLVLFLVAFVVFFAVLCVNAAKCKPVVSNTQVKDVKLDIDAEEKAKRLAKLIRCKTISNKDASLIDQSEFDKFKETLRELYPTVYAKAELEEIAGGLLFKIQGKSSMKPSVLMAHFDVVPVNEDKECVTCACLALASERFEQVLLGLCTFNACHSFCV